MNDEGKTRIPDGPGRFPNSCVLFSYFRTPDLRVMFAFLRQKEEILQKSLEQSFDQTERMIVRAKLHEVEAHLMWMSSNLSSDPSRSER